VALLGGGAHTVEDLGTVMAQGLAEWKLWQHGLGNIGPASIPTTLAHAAGGYSRGQRVACMGIGSGLNAAVIEIDW
jgi:3-oxoacyl-[acyl-carrier-protein] synthase III